MSIENIIRTFCFHRHVPPEDINAVNNRRVNDTKYMIWMYLHCEMGISTNQIAKRFGRNRPSVFRGIRIIRHEFGYHKELREEYQNIVKKIEGASTDTPSENME